MEILEKQVNGILVLTLCNKRLDASIAIAFKNNVIACIDNGNGKVLINMNNVDFIDSSGLGAVVSCLKHMGSNGKIGLSNLSPAATAMFKLTRMDKVFAIYADESDALDAL